MIRLVNDTNVFVSALISTRSIPALLLDGNIKIINPKTALELLNSGQREA